MNRFTHILREHALFQEAIMAQIHQIASTASGFDIRAIQERINRISTNVFQEEQISDVSKQGTIFIKDYILSDVTEKTLTLFKALDPSIYIFMLTKAIFLFTLGSKANDQVPGFFKASTKERIEKQRREIINNPHKECIANELQKKMKDFDKFEDVSRKDVENMLTCLKGIAYEEIHNGLLATKCLMDAI